MRPILYAFFFLVLFIACDEKGSQDSSLEAENDRLKNKIIELENRIRLSDNPQVSLANTAVEKLTSTFNEQEYQIKISYPKSYFANQKKRFPVLYVLDAETNFGGVSYIVQRLIKDKLIPEILVVGIAYNTDYRNFYRLRSRDLTPVKDKDLRMGKNIDPTGGAPEFSAFLEFELFPFIDKQYRTQKEDRAIYGHSYGGLFGAYVLLEKPQLFNRYLLLGPSLWYIRKTIGESSCQYESKF
ncbi:MAG: alpha/beta hydrolase-fold protein [Bacteroidota bacterium]